eukprot:TRINITY_DN1341_c0_g4_i1.p1 TRINITY_DN1341_c0_g4~~TRINITY_DN1341_c0_g4_i1.p1  ORF type:complete len:210 (+),score=29.30 TRINITY_DN1341_c0_g4_i1:203-832(+)
MSIVPTPNTRTWHNVQAYPMQQVQTLHTVQAGPMVWSSPAGYSSPGQRTYQLPQQMVASPSCAVTTLPSQAPGPLQPRVRSTISAAEEAAKAAATISAGPADHAFVEQKVSQRNLLVLFSKTYCPFVIKAKQVLASISPQPLMDVIELDLMGQPRHGPIQQVLRQRTGSSTVPQGFVNGQYIGGCQEICNMHAAGQLVPLLQRLGCQFS